MRRLGRGSSGRGRGERLDSDTARPGVGEVRVLVTSTAGDNDCTESGCAARTSDDWLLRGHGYGPLVMRRRGANMVLGGVRRDGTIIDVPT